MPAPSFSPVDYSAMSDVGELNSCLLTDVSLL
jgi:hypothetical protein